MDAQLQNIKQSLLPELEKNHITFLAVFGSHAANTQTKRSDVDLLVKFSKQKGLFDLVDLESEFSEKLGKKVDLVTENSLNKFLKDDIKTSMKVLYEK